MCGREAPRPGSPPAGMAVLTFAAPMYALLCPASPAARPLCWRAAVTQGSAVMQGTLRRRALARSRQHTAGPPQARRVQPQIITEDLQNVPATGLQTMVTGNRQRKLQPAGASWGPAMPSAATVAAAAGRAIITSARRRRASSPAYHAGIASSATCRLRPSRRTRPARLAARRPAAGLQPPSSAGHVPWVSWRSMAVVQAGCQPPSVGDCRRHAAPRH